VDRVFPAYLLLEVPKWLGIGSFALADGAVHRENWGGREGPNVATWPTLTHACPKKGCPPS